MTLKTGLVTALVAAIVAALVAAATLAVVLRTAPEAIDQPAAAALDEKAIVDVVRKHLTENPEILVEMTTELEERQQVKQAEHQKEVISDNSDAIFRSPLAYTAGNPDGDVTVVEFFDYNCGYCRRAMPELVKLIEDDDKVRVVFKELPIFGEESEGAAKVALAAGKQGKYFEMHQKLFAAQGKVDKDKALRVANELGLDIPQLEKDMEDPSVEQSLEETRELAQKLGLQGTPLYLIGDIMLPGAPDDLHDQLVERVTEIREKGCAATC
jgi:protein-disulfide isomerase